MLLLNQYVLLNLFIINNEIFYNVIIFEHFAVEMLIVK